MAVRYENAIVNALAKCRDGRMEAKGSRSLAARIANCIGEDRNVPGVLSSLFAMHERGKIHLRHDESGRLREVRLRMSFSQSH